MAQIDFRKIGNDWIAFTDVVTPDADTTYRIYNRGPHVVLACEADAMPTGQEGDLLRPYETLVYKKGKQTLYLKAFGETYINTTSDK